MAIQRKKYRPGIDDPPPHFLVWLGAALGLTAALGFLRTLMKRKKAN